MTLEMIGTQSIHQDYSNPHKLIFPNVDRSCGVTASQLGGGGLEGAGAWGT